MIKRFGIVWIKKKRKRKKRRKEKENYRGPFTRAERSRTSSGSVKAILRRFAAESPLPSFNYAHTNDFFFIPLLTPSFCLFTRCTWRHHLSFTFINWPLVVTGSRMRSLPIVFSSLSFTHTHAHTYTHTLSLSLHAHTRLAIEERRRRTRFTTTNRA